MYVTELKTAKNHEFSNYEDIIRDNIMFNASIKRWKAQKTLLELESDQLISLDALSLRSQYHVVSTEPWYSSLMISKALIRFKMDSGDETNVHSTPHFGKSGPTEIVKLNIKLVAYGGSRISFEREIT